jgi:hypothetical protein
MIEAGLHRITDRLEDIGSAAGKEFALETAMEKMKQVRKMIKIYKYN